MLLQQYFTVFGSSLPSAFGRVGSWYELTLLFGKSLLSACGRVDSWYELTDPLRIVRILLYGASHFNCCLYESSNLGISIAIYSSNELYN